MKRIALITLLAVILLTVAAIGWVYNLVHRPLAQESHRPGRRERLELRHQLSESRRRARVAADVAPFPAAFAR